MSRLAVCSIRGSRCGEDLIDSERSYEVEQGAPVGRRGPSSVRWLLVLDLKIVIHVFDTCHLCRQFACSDLLFGIFDDAQQVDRSVRGFHVNAC